jgi:hypothetical protein
MTETALALGIGLAAHLPERELVAVLVIWGVVGLLVDSVRWVVGRRAVTRG